MKATINSGTLQLTMSLLEAVKWYESLPNGDPAKAALNPVLAPTDLSTLVDSWPWHGSTFPEEDCFNAIKHDIAEEQYEAVRKLIRKRARFHNARLE